MRQKEKGIDIRKFQDPEGRNIPERRVEGCWEIRAASTIEIEIFNKAIPTYSWLILLLTNSHYGILDKLSCISYTSNKGRYSQSYSFSNSHVWTWELDHKEGWALKNWCFWMVVIEKTLESPLDCKETKPVNPKGNQPWMLTERTVAELKLQYFGHIVWRADFLEKTLMLGKTEGKRRMKQQRMRWVDSLTNSMDMSLSNLGDIVEDRRAWCATVHRVTKSWNQLSDWTTSYTLVSKLWYFRFLKIYFGSFIQLSSRNVD